MLLKKGELALGRNLVVAFMPWKRIQLRGCHRNQRKSCTKTGLLQSTWMNILFEVRDTKLGMEELTADIPNVSEEATKDLDENGMIRIGAEVKPGDIMIGKITPKGESDPTPEEKL